MQYEAQNELMRQKITQLEKDTEGKEGKWKLMLTEKENELCKKVGDYKEKVKKLEESNTEKEKELIRVKADLEKTNALSEQQLKYLDSRAKEQTSKVEALQQELKNYKAKLDEKSKQIYVTFIIYIINYRL